jgi:hypothetical protein
MSTFQSRGEASRASKRKSAHLELGVGLLAAQCAVVLLLVAVEKVRDAFDRAT